MNLHKSIFQLVLVFMLLPIGVVAEAKTVLVIQSYHQEYLWDSDYFRAINDLLGAQHEIKRFSLDTKRLPPEQFENKAQQAWAYYLEVQPDLVIIGDDNAMIYLGPRLGETKTPVVFLGVNGSPNAMGFDKYSNIKGILERPLFDEMIKHLRLVMKPKPTKLLALFDNSLTAQTAVGDFFQGKTSVKVRGVQLDLVLTNDYDIWRRQFADAQKRGYAGIIVGTYHTIKDKSGAVRDAAELISWAAAKSDLPVFCFWDFAAGEGKAVGGYVLSGYDQGRMAAQMAAMVFRGVPIQQLQSRVGDQGRYIYSLAQMQHWSIHLNPMVASKAEFLP